MIFKLLDLSFKGFFRKENWEKNIFIIILTIIMGVYFMSLNAFIGIMADKILGAFANELTILEYSTNLLFYLVVYESLVRIIGGKSQMIQLKSLTLLPVAKSKLLHASLIQSVFSLFNLLTTTVFFFFALKHVFWNYSFSTVFSWTIFIGLFIASTHYFITYLKLLFTYQIKKFFLIAIALITCTLLSVFEILPINEYIGWLLRLSFTTSFGLLIPLLILSLSYWNAYRLNYKLLYHESASKMVNFSSKISKGLIHSNGVQQLIRYELLLIFRNKRPRTLFIIGLIMPIYFLLIFIDSDTPLVLDNGLFISIAPLVFIASAMNYAGLLISWESNHFPLLMIRIQDFKQYIKAKHQLLILLGLPSTLIAIGIYSSLDINNLLPLLGFTIYSFGITLPMYLFISRNNTKAVHLEKSAFGNFEGSSAVQMLMGLPVIFMHIPIYFGMEVFIEGSGIYSVAILGVIGILLNKLIVQKITQLLMKRKHRFLEGFANS